MTDLEREEFELATRVVLAAQRLVRAYGRSDSGVPPFGVYLALERAVNDAEKFVERQLAPNSTTI